VGIIITAAYVLRVVGQVFFGEFDEARIPRVTPITNFDKVALGLLVFWLVLLGVYPKSCADDRFRRAADRLDAGR